MTTGLRVHHPGVIPGHGSKQVAMRVAAHGTRMRSMRQRSCTCRGVVVLGTFLECTHALRLKLPDRVESVLTQEVKTGVKILVRFAQLVPGSRP